MLLKKIFETSDLDGLRRYLAGFPDREELRQRLYASFVEHATYTDVAGWNAAVRLCEALAIVGWGEHEPQEAIRGVYFNGNPETYFVNRHGRPRFFDAVWSRRKEGFAIDYDLSFDHGTAEAPLSEPLRRGGGVGVPQNMPLCSQRNWIAKNPIRIVRGLANCYASSRPVAESIGEVLMPALNSNMHPELYGSAINAIVINVSFSFYDNDHCKTNYIIADESLKLTQKDFYPKLLELFPADVIEQQGYYLRNRFALGPFRKDTGTVRVNIVLEKEFSDLSVAEQKRLLSTYLLQAVERVQKRLQPKVSYDFPLMISDFKTLLSWWCCQK